MGDVQQLMAEGSEVLVLAAGQLHGESLGWAVLC